MLSLGSCWNGHEGCWSTAGRSSSIFGVEPTPVKAELVARSVADEPLFTAGGTAEPVNDRERVSVPRVVATSSRLLFETLAGVYDDLGFDVVGDEAFRDLVIARIVEPTSILDVGRVLRDLGQSPASEKTLRRTLVRCVGREYRDKIAGACFARALSAGDLSLVLYDVTTLVFRGREGRRPAEGRLLQGAPGRSAGRGRAAGRPGRLPARDRLLRGQQGRVRHEVACSKWVTVKEGLMVT